MEGVDTDTDELTMQWMKEVINVITVASRNSGMNGGDKLKSSYVIYWEYSRSIEEGANRYGLRRRWQMARSQVSCGAKYH